MGYYTSFELDVTSNSEDGYEVIEKFKEYNESAEYALEGNSTKWYDHEKDLKEFSKKYPDEIFILSGIGEDQPDMWKLYVKNGKSHKVMAQINYPEYNESLLS